MINYILKLIFPERCVFCGKPIKLQSDNKYVCEKCGINMPYYNKTAKLDEEGPVTGISVFAYSSVRDTIHRFKYDGYRNYGYIMGRMMAEYVLDNSVYDIMTADLITAVPLWKEKERKRGFNQSGLLAETISDIIGVPYVKNMLKRTKSTAPQSGLTKEERRNNLKRAFEFNNRYDVNDKSIVIVDDIYTTGSTVFECAKCLYAAGAKEVIYFSLSVAANRDDETEYSGNDIIRVMDDDELPI